MKKTVKNPMDERKDLLNPALDASVDLESRARSALQMMKAIEAERKEKMVECRIDRHTVVCATPERLKEIKKELKVR